MNQSLVMKIKRNKFVRILCYPFEQLRRGLRFKRYQRSEDASFIRELKDTHNGERCFVIGNGPSLRPEDLDALWEHHIFCFGANRIYRIYPKTKWRPSIYLALDTFVIADDFEHIKSAGEYPKIINYNSAKFGRTLEENIYYVCVHEPFQIETDRISTDTLSDDPSVYSVKTGTVTVNAIELAVYMGFQEIYLLGVDNNYAKKRSRDGKVYTDSSVEASYFEGGEPDKSLGEAVQEVEYMNASYEIARNFADRHHVKIFNATRGGKLEVFERVDFDELMSQKAE